MPDQDFELVNKIENVELEIIGDPPVHVISTVNGSVRTTGYTTPLLIIKSTTPDSEGALTFYFAAKPPDPPRTPGNPITIRAQRTLNEVRGVRKLIFVSATNQVVKAIQAKKE